MLISIMVGSERDQATKNAGSIERLCKYVDTCMVGKDIEEAKKKKQD